MKFLKLSIGKIPVENKPALTSPPVALPILSSYDLCAHKSLCVPCLPGRFPLAAIQGPHSGVALDCSLWFPIFSSVPEFLCESTYGPDAMCPLQTGKAPSPIGTSIQFDSAKRWARRERPHPCQLLQSIFPCCTLLRLLGFNPALFYLKMAVSGETELAWGRTGLNSEPFPHYQSFWNIYFASFFRIKFCFKVTYKGIVCYCNSVSCKCAQNSSLPCIQQCICISEDFTELLKLLYMPNCLQLQQ